jgi:hypothetical protein
MSPEGGAESVALTEIRQARRYRQRGADDTSEFSKDRREPVPWIGIEAQFVVTAPQVLNERRPSADHSGRAEPFEPTDRFQPGFEPTMIGFDGLFAYCSTTWHAEASSSSSTRGYMGARSVLTPAGRGPCSRARVKNRRVAAKSRFCATTTSMTWPCWSIARYS